MAMPDRLKLNANRERVQERNELIIPLQRLLHLPSSRRNQREFFAEEGRQRLSAVIEKYPHHKEIVTSLYTKMVGIHRAIGMGDAVVSALLKEGKSQVFQGVKDHDARSFLSLLYASNTLRSVSEKGRQGISPTKANVQATKQEEAKKLARVFGIDALDKPDAKKISFALVIDKILEGEL